MSHYYWQYHYKNFEFQNISQSLTLISLSSTDVSSFLEILASTQSPIAISYMFVVVNFDALAQASDIRF